jgi:flagellar motor switch protein FliM
MLDDIPYEPLDLLDDMRLPQLRSQLMETLSDRFMRQIGFDLFQRMRHSVQLLSCINGVISHDSALSSLPDIMLAGIADLTPLRGRMLVAIDGDLIGAVVDGMCGATTARPFQRDDLSALEIRIGRQMIDLTFATISDVLSSLTPMPLKAVTYESSPGMLAIADGQDWMIASTGIFETALGSGTIKVVAPYSGFEPLEVKFTSQSMMLGQSGTDASWIAAVDAMTETTSIEIRFELARVRISIGVFAAIGVGDILPFFLNEDAVAAAGNIDLFLADYGQNDGFICCRAKAPGPPTSEASMVDQKERSPGEVRTAESDKLADKVELERIQPLTRGGPVIGGKAVLDRVTVMLTVELGRTQMTIKDLRQLRHGQIIPLDQTVGDSLTIFANGQKLAYGEVVAVANDHYGVRVTALAEDADPTAEIGT